MPVWIIAICEDDQEIGASIVNVATGNTQRILITRADYLDRDEAIGELFCGSLPNIRDSFDKV